MKKHLFKIILLVYALILIAVIAFFVRRLHRFLFAYENSVSENAVEEIVDALRTGNLSDYEITLACGEKLGDNAPFMERTRIRAFLMNQLAGANVSWQKINSESSESSETYTVFVNGEKCFRLLIESPERKGEYRLPDWKGRAIELLDPSVDPVDLSFRVPEDATVYVDEKALTEEYVTGEERVTLTDTVVSLGYTNEPAAYLLYTVRGIFISPDIRVEGPDGTQLDCSADEDGVYRAEHSLPPGFEQEAKSLAMQIIPVWGRYFSRDGSFDALRHYFVTGSPVDRYVPNVDISWMQAHKGVTFSDERVDHIRYYSDSCFSCEVHFVQTILHDDPARQREWETHLTWIFVRQNADDEWKIADLLMHTGTE